MKPALVRFKGNTDKEKIHGKIYKAYGLDYWNNKLKCLYIKGETGAITGWHNLDEFEVIEDKDNVINPAMFKKAIVRYKGMSVISIDDCEREDYLYPFLWLAKEQSRDTYLINGKEYIAVGLDRKLFNTLAYHVLTEEGYTYSYDARLFDIVSDPDGILDPETGKQVFDFSDFEE